MDDAIKSIETFFGYFFKMVGLALLAVIFLPAFLIVNSLNKTWENLLKEFGL
jgi:hypothetical protein